MSLPCSELTRGALRPKRAKMSGLERVINQQISLDLRWRDLISSEHGGRRQGDQGPGATGMGFNLSVKFPEVNYRRNSMPKCPKRIPPRQFHAYLRKGLFLGLRSPRKISRKGVRLGRRIRFSTPKNIVKMTGI